jgi:uncharacterized protein
MGERSQANRRDRRITVQCKMLLQTSMETHKVESKFELNKDVAGEYRFKLIATNGLTIAVSQGYNTKESALKGIESVKQNAGRAAIEDTTL